MTTTTLTEEQKAQRKAQEDEAIAKQKARIEAADARYKREADEDVANIQEGLELLVEKRSTTLSNNVDPTGELRRSLISVCRTLADQATRALDRY